MEVLGGLEIGGVSVLFLVFGLVEFIKKLGVGGTGLTVAAMVTGVLVGVVVKLVDIYPVINVWVEVGVLGLAYGLAAAGIFDFVNSRFPKVETAADNDELRAVLTEIALGQDVQG